VVPTLAPTPTTGVAPAPTTAPTIAGTGMLHLTTGPDYDHHDPLQLRYVLADGQPAADGDAFESETIVYVDRQLPAGPIRVLANDTECTGPLAIEANVEVDVVLAVDNGACTISLVTSHAPGAIVHPEPRTAIGALIEVDSILVVKPLDPGSSTAELQLPASDRGEVLGIELTPGRYELSVLVDGAVHTTKEFDVKRGTDFVYNLRVLAPDVPRECGDITETECEAAVAEAYAWGYFLESGHRVTSVTVRDSPYTGGCQPYDPPALQVEFVVLQVGGASSTVQVTLGRRPAGTFFVCTY